MSEILSRNFQLLICFGLLLWQWQNTNTAILIDFKKYGEISANFELGKLKKKNRRGFSSTKTRNQINLERKTKGHLQTWIPTNGPVLSLTIGCLPTWVFYYTNLLSFYENNCCFFFQALSIGFACLISWQKGFSYLWQIHCKKKLWMNLGVSHI
jgi:hypothetical protein